MAVSNLNVRIGADTRGLRGDLARADMMFKRFNGTVASMGATLNAAFGGFAIFQGLSYGIREIASLEYEMDAVRALTGATERQFQQLSDNARQLGASTRYTAQEIAKLQQEYGRLGFSTSEILKVTDSTTKLSIATGEDLAQSALIAGTTLRQYNLEASEMGRVNDVIAASLNKSALDLNTFAEAMKYVGPVAASAGVSLEETAAMISVLADSGIKGSQAGTSLRRILTDMAATGKPAKEALRDVAMRGIELTDAMDEVGRYAQTALLVLSNQTVKLDDLTGSYQNANGELDKMAKIMEDNLIGDWYKFTSAIDGAIQKGNVLTGVLRAIVQAGTKVLNSPAYLISVQAGQAQEQYQLAALKQKQKEQEKFNALVEKGVQLAFDSGNVDDFIKSLNRVEESGVTIKDALTQQATTQKDQLKLLQFMGVKEELILAIKERQKQVDQIRVNSIIEQNKKLQEQQQIYQKNIASQRFDGITGMRSNALPDIAGFTEQFQKSDLIKKMGEDIGTFTLNTNHAAEAIMNMGQVWAENSEIFVNKSMIQAEAMATLTAGLAEYVGLLASGQGNAEAFSSSVIEPIANMAIQLGKLTMAGGFAILGLRESLRTLNPVAAIAAGAGLVAIGTAIKGLGKSGGGSGGSSGGGGGYSSYSPQPIEVNIGGEFVMRGDDMVVILNRATQKRRYTKG